ncbi:hypothetical protein PAXRUDRAFT_141985, partial [Paxillus rubicundulus Ve08.2h10]
ESLTKKRLDTLQHYLSNLPDVLPLPEPGLANYNFDLFGISAEDIKDYGEVGTINCQLKISFGSRHNGPIPLAKCGPGLVQVVKVLSTYLLKDPISAILQKWVDGLTISAKISFDTNGLNSKILDNSHDPDYEDIAGTTDSHKSGAKILPLLLQVSNKSCCTSWSWPHYCQCILVHDYLIYMHMLYSYKPDISSTCSITPEDELVVNKATKIGCVVCIHLQGCCNLIITFDGGKIHKPNSVYIIHVTTAE